jgi:hypothetical protein
MFVKRLSAILILILFSAILVSPAVATAEEAVECCKLKHNIKVGDDTDALKTAGTVVGRVSPTSATIAQDCPMYNEGTGYEQVSNWAVYCSLDAIKTIADLVNVVAIVLSGVVFVAAGTLFVTAGGNPNRVTLAKNFFYGGLIGVSIMVLSKFIPAFARFFLGI